MQHDSRAPPTTPPAPGTTDVQTLYSRLLGNPQVNADKAISTFREEFEAKKTLFTEKDDGIVSTLQQVPAQLISAKEHLDSNLSSTQSTAVEKLQALQQAIAASSQACEKPTNPTRSAKEVFEKDINDARDAFDQEMALRHADVVKQYVGMFVQQIDYY
ncbi:hypothetical protein BGZ47_004448 [Haplosporangium gracile]|nr:hypothetical protein BGZ47_004448 [Haplosporangium gracile]